MSLTHGGHGGMMSLLMYGRSLKGTADRSLLLLGASRMTAGKISMNMTASSLGSLGSPGGAVSPSLPPLPGSPGAAAV